MSYANLLNFLEDGGYTGNVSDALKQFLVDQGHSGQTNEALFRYLRAEGYEGTLAEMYTTWTGEPIVSLVTEFIREASTSTSRYAHSGHSLTDAYMYGNNWPGDMVRIRNAAQDPDDSGDVYVIKDTIPGSPMFYRWAQNTVTRTGAANHDGLIITESGPPAHDSVFAFEENVLDYLCRFTANQIENGAGNDVAVWTIWPSLDGVNAPNPAPPEWSAFSSFSAGLPEYGRVFEKAADYTTWKMHQLYPSLPNDWRVWVYPGHRWMQRIEADLATSSVPGVTVIADLFEDDIHPNNWGDWGLCVFVYTCMYKESLSGVAAVAAQAPADIPPGMHEYFCNIAWDIANNYPRAGFGGTIVPQWTYEEDGDYMPNWTLANPTVVGHEYPSGDLPTFLLEATADDYSDLATYSGTQPVVSGGVLQFTPVSGVQEQLKGALASPTGAVGAYLVAAVLIDPLPASTKASMIMLSSEANTWWQGNVFGLSSNGYLGGRWIGFSDATELNTALNDTAQVGEYSLVEVWTDVTTMYMRVNGGPIATLARAEAFTPLTHLHLFDGNGAGSTFSIAALGIVDGVPDEPQRIAARQWAQSFVPL